MLGTLSLGWGFRAAAGSEAFADCWAQACTRLPALMQSGVVLRMAMLADRFDQPAGRHLREWAAMHVPGALWLPCDEQDLRQWPTRHQSTRVLQRFATGSVCEALALRGAAQDCAMPDSQTPAPTLLVPRIVSADHHATLAVAGIWELLPSPQPSPAGGEGAKTIQGSNR